MARLWLNALSVTLAKATAKIKSHGKFFSRSGQKFFFKAIRFTPSGDMHDLTQKLAIHRRFDELSRAHTTGLIIAMEHADALLGIAAQFGFQVMVEIPVSLDEVNIDRGMRALNVRIVKAVELWHGDPALAGYLIDCPVDPAFLRHQGLSRVQNRLAKLIQAIQGSAPGCLVAVKHRPATIGLAMRDEDLVYAEMPPLAPAELRSYVIKLHNLAEARPIVLEFGEGLPGQDEVVACAFGLGAAGVVAPAMLPAASPGSLGIRALSAGELLPFVTLNRTYPPKPPATPIVSVVICAYNAERTMRDCLESLRKLDYPNYEVVIVDDGSRDSTAHISSEYPEFRLIRQPNKGLSIARNAGAHAANGEIIAYTDSDCVVDPHWLTLMVRSIVENGFDGCGGPNYAPHEDGWIESCVAASPGAPCHVLTGDDRAEHLAGCNMVFRKAALDAIGGFDPQFTAAGDDVDICWRMLDGGYTLGFCPSAFVWHFRRNTVKAYYGQQRGYGKAEAMLFPKYPERFNALGQIRWRGTIPGIARTFPGGARNRIGWRHRAGQFQHIADAPLSIAKVLPLTAEWDAAGVVALVLLLGMGITVWPALAMLALGPIWALYYASRAPLEKSHSSFMARMLIAWLAYTGPISRTIARYRYRRISRGSGQLEAIVRQRPTLDWRHHSVRLTYWSEAWIPRDSLLEKIARHHALVGRPTTVAQGWRDADLTLEPGALTQVEIKTADEEHSGGRLKNHVAIRARLSGLTLAGLTLSAIAFASAAFLGDGAIAAAFGIIDAGLTVCAASEAIETLRLAYRVVEQSASELGLTPLGLPTRAGQRAIRAQPIPVKAQNTSINGVNEAALNS